MFEKWTEMWFFGIVIVLFTGLYFVLSLDPKCWYRRYILPVMFLVLAAVYWQDLVAIFFALAALFTYLGQRGYGQQKIAIEKEIKEEIKEEKEEKNEEKKEVEE